jgi:phosphotransferase system  glucose/maltose/N-acetylglucosamine-specific IIC component
MIDFSDHRVIAIMVAIGIAFVAVIAILCRFFIRQHRKKTQQEKATNQLDKENK